MQHILVIQEQFGKTSLQFFGIFLNWTYILSGRMRKFSCGSEWAEKNYFHSFTDNVYKMLQTSLATYLNVQKINTC